MIIKLLVWLIIATVGYHLIKRMVRSITHKPKKNSVANEAMVKCRHCGIHIPKSQAIDDGEDHHFCSVDHRQAYKDSQQ